MCLCVRVCVCMCVCICCFYKQIATEVLHWCTPLKHTADFHKLNIYPLLRLFRRRVTLLLVPVLLCMSEQCMLRRPTSAVKVHSSKALQARTPTASWLNVTLFLNTCSPRLSTTPSTKATKMRLFFFKVSQSDNKILLSLNCKNNKCFSKEWGYIQCPEFITLIK